MCPPRVAVAGFRGGGLARPWDIAGFREVARLGSLGLCRIFACVDTIFLQFPCFLGCYFYELGLCEKNIFPDTQNCKFVYLGK